MKKLIFVIILLSTQMLFGQYTISVYSGADTSGYNNGERASALFNSPFGLCKDNSGNIFIADAGNNCIRRIDLNGIVTTFVGTGIAGSKDGVRGEAEFYEPTGICTDHLGNFFVADFMNHLIRKISAGGEVTTIAGNGTPGLKDGVGTEAQFNYPRGICIDSKGNLYVGDSWNHRIRKISPEGIVTTFAGGGDDIGTESKGSFMDAKGSEARFFTPCGLAIDKNDNVYVADALNHRIRKIDPAGNVTTLAGTGESGWENGAFADGDKSIAKLNTPTEVFAVADGQILFSDTFNNRVRYISTDGLVKTIAGSDDGLDYPRGIVADELGEIIFIVNFNKNQIVKISIE